MKLKQKALCEIGEGFLLPCVLSSGVSLVTSFLELRNRLKTGLNLLYCCLDTFANHH